MTAAPETLRTLERAVRAAVAEPASGGTAARGLALPLSRTAVAEALQRALEAAERPGAAAPGPALAALGAALADLRRHFPAGSPGAERIALARWLCDALERELDADETGG